MLEYSPNQLESLRIIQEYLTVKAALIDLLDPVEIQTELQLLQQQLLLIHSYENGLKIRLERLTDEVSQ
jgi:hypothetical protein